MKRSINKLEGYDDDNSSYKSKRSKGMSLSSSLLNSALREISLSSVRNQYGKDDKSEPKIKDVPKFSNTDKKQNVEETKENDNSDSNLDFSISSLSSHKVSPDKKNDQQAKLDHLKAISNAHEELEDVVFENCLFTIISVEYKGQERSTVYRSNKILMKINDKQYEDLPIEFKCTLKHGWSRCPLDEGDVVRAIGKFSKKNDFSLIFDDIPIESESHELTKGRFLVLEPEILIPSTSISTAHACARVPQLRELFKNAEGDPGYPLVFGNIVHLLFQKILENIPDLYIARNQHKLEQAISESMQDQLILLYMLREKIDESKLNEDIQDAVQKIYTWLDTFKEQSKNQLQLKFKKQIAAEQEIHSTMYGVKGKIDSTVIFKDDKNKDRVTAVELKTGKRESPSYNGQVTLYLMILKEVFSNPNTKHLLVYIMKDSKSVSVSYMDNQCKTLIQNRNILCKHKKYIREGKYILPPMIKDEYQCNKCYSKDVCCANSISFNQVCSDGSAPEFKHYTDMKARLTESEIEYFKQWVQAINSDQVNTDHASRRKFRNKEDKKQEVVGEIVEEKEEGKSESSITDEEKRSLLKKVTLESELKMTKVSPLVKGFVAHLEREVDIETCKKLKELDQDTCGVKELDEQAYVYLRPSDISVVFTHGLITKKNYYISDKRNSALPEDLENLKSAKLEYIVEYPNEEYYNMLEDALGGKDFRDFKWQLEKEPFSNFAYSLMRSNIFQLINNDGTKHLRDVIVNSSEPKYDENFDADKFKTTYSSQLANLDESQIEAVCKAYSSTNYHLINGIEKAGKSSTCATLLDIYSKTNKKILVTDNKNEELDELLLKLVDKKVSFVRVASKSWQVHEEVRSYVKSDIGFKDTNEIEQMMADETIYAATCLSSQNNILHINKPFDVCIVENAHSIFEPRVIGAILLSKKFILFGNSKEKPLESSSVTKQLAKNVSLFHKLFDANEEHVSNLKYSYLE